MTVLLCRDIGLCYRLSLRPEPANAAHCLRCRLAIHACPSRIHEPYKTCTRPNGRPAKNPNKNSRSSAHPSPDFRSCQTKTADQRCGGGTADAGSRSVAGRLGETCSCSVNEVLGHLTPP